MTTPTPAEILAGILEQLPATGTAQDRRVRRALAAAADALRRGGDPLDAIARTYERRTP